MKKSSTIISRKNNGITAIVAAAIALSTPLYGQTINCPSDTTVTLNGACSATITLPQAQSGYVGPTNTALSFDGSNDYVNIGNLLSSNSSYTKEAWVYSNGSQTGNIISAPNYPFWLDNNRLAAANNFGAMNYWVQDTAQFPVGEWVHVAVTYNAGNSTMTVYKNGSSVGSITWAPGFSAGNLHIGAWQSGHIFNGMIDEVRIWNVARSHADIIANMHKTVPASNTGLVARYNFNNSNPSGSNAGLTTLADHSGNGNNGTLHNFALQGGTSNWVCGIPQLGNCDGTPVITNSFNNTGDASGTYTSGTTVITWTATDASGNTATCTQKVTLVSNVVTTITITPANNVYTGGISEKLYLGYGPQSVTMSANAPAGSTYSWSPASGLSCTTCASPVFTASTPGAYTYTVAVVTPGGCTTTTSKTIYVKDVRCGNKNDKVEVCQVPPGNPSKAKTICVSPNAVPAHLSKDSYLGACGAAKGGKNALNVDDERNKLEEHAEQTSLKVYPNPNNGNFIIELPTGMKSVRAQVLDMSGRVVETIASDGKARLNISLGNVARGMYIVLVQSETEAYRTLVNVQ